MSDRIGDLIEEIVVDAYGENEQLWSFRQVFEDDARFPFRGRVVGAGVEIISVDFDGDERRGLVAVCRREGEVHKVSLLDVTPEGPLPLRTRQLPRRLPALGRSQATRSCRAAPRCAVGVPTILLGHDRPGRSPGVAADG